MIEESDHRRLENERRQIERYDLGYLFLKEARLQVNTRANAGLAQLARFVESRYAEVVAALIDQGARDGHRAMPISVGLDHDHQLAVRGDGPQRTKVRAQRAEIDLGDGRALRFNAHRKLNFPS